MSDRTILGQVLDPRVTRCGVTIEGDGMIRVRPFLETSQAVAGSFSIRVGKLSASGMSTTNQAGSFSGELGNVVIGLNGPATLDVTMALDDRAGLQLCRFEQRISV